MGPLNIAEHLTETDAALITMAENNQEETPAPAWPEPVSEVALSGIAGDIVQAIGPETEADPAAILFSFLTMFGNAAGRNAYFLAEADRHYPNLFTCLVGASSKGRKGTSYGQALRLLSAVDEEWATGRIAQGMSSGEGLIWGVRDEVIKQRRNKKGEIEEVVEVDGVDDKRMLCVEQEFASTVRVLKREGNTLSAVIRKCWDDGSLSTLTKNSPARATGAHISILAHSTIDELIKHLDSTELGNGFANRFLWTLVRRSKCLPDGGNMSAVNFAGIISDLNQALQFSKRNIELKRDVEARSLWHSIYPELSEGKPGLLGAVIARAEAQVMRLASIYALLDLSEVIKADHLEAALACWDYCEASARFIFGESLGDPAADETLKALEGAGPEGMTKTELHNHFGRNRAASELARALSLLEAQGIIRREKCLSPGGRSVERFIK